MCKPGIEEVRVGTCLFVLLKKETDQCPIELEFFQETRPFLVVVTFKPDPEKGGLCPKEPFP